MLVMPPRLFLVVWLLCYMYVVLSRSQSDEDLPELLRVCADALNQSNNTNHSYSSFRKCTYMLEHFVVYTKPICQGL